MNRFCLSRRILLLIFASSLAFFCVATPLPATPPALEAGALWDVERLLGRGDAAPQPTVEEGDAEQREHCSIRPIWYAGEPYQGKPTRVFAYLGIPKIAKKRADNAGETAGSQRFPGILLIHGGGGKAFDQWAEHWASRGYVALAMDLAGCGPDGKAHENAGPGQSDVQKFGDFDRNAPASIRDMWTYHAVADILLAHALLAKREDVDPKRIAATGISWGGYLTCILAGVDPDLAAAVPVYGCGFLYENSAWLDRFVKMPPQKREDWIALFDPGSYLGRVKCPMLFVNGTNDLAYPLDSYRKSFRSARRTGRDVAMCLEINRPHSHIWTFPEVDAFIDEYCRPEEPLPPLYRITDGDTARLDDGKTVFTAEIRNREVGRKNPTVKAVDLCYTEDSGPWKDRQWKTVPGKIDGQILSATLPGEGVTAFFLQVIDEFDRKISTPHHLYDPRRDSAILEEIAQLRRRVDPDNGFPVGTHGQPKGYHSNFDKGTRVRPTRTAMDYAALLISSPEPEHRDRGRELLDRVLQLQDRDPESRTFGLWSWYVEEPLAEMAAPDYNWADFLGAVLAVLLHDYSDRLAPELREQCRTALEYCTRSIIKRDVGPGYTNIAMMGATVSAAAGELLDRQDFLEYGRNRITRNLAHYRETGGFNEYNSPSYTTVVVAELERMLALVSDPACREAAETLRVEAWKTIAEHYHVPTGQWAGPHSRNYGDLFRGRIRDAVLFRAGALPDGTSEPVSIFVPLLPCPEDLRPFFTTVPAEAVERRHVFVPGRAHFEETGTTWMDAEATIGSASYHSYWTQSRGLIAYWNAADGTPVVLKTRFLHDGEDFAAAWGRNRQNGSRIVSAFGCLRNRGSMHPSFDRPKDGVFQAESFQIVYQLQGQGVAAKELEQGRYELSAGKIRAVLHPAPGCSFDDKPVVWELQREGDDLVRLVGTCYAGPRRAFAMNTLEDSRLAVGAELLHEGETPSNKPVVLRSSKFKTDRDGVFYDIQWEPATGVQSLSAPLRPTDYR